MNKLLTHYQRIPLKKTRLCTTFVYVLHRVEANYIEIGLGYESRDGLNIRHFQEEVIPFGYVKTRAQEMTWSGRLFKKIPEDMLSLFGISEGSVFLFDGDPAQEFSIMMTEITRELCPAVYVDPLRNRKELIGKTIMAELNRDLK